ncbi:MAG: acyl transferase [Flavobacteriales bacterium]|nr:acyl transferase [Flavobacteriales bacterium]|tara:strand:- start:163 stop:1149 length:987 start_codon:yes stop_codon:yes gene_type:complete
MSFQSLEEKVFQIDSDSSFEELALQLFKLQHQTNTVYRKYCDLIECSADKVTRLNEIPFLPIQFFKSEQVISTEFEAEITFKSSGTGGNRSKHILKKLELYKKSFKITFEQFYGSPKDLAILALLPSYIEQGESSLIYMCDHLIKESRYEESGYFLYEHKELLQKLESLAKENTPTLLIGVSYALLDLVEENEIPKHNKLIVMETGGMKGRKKELIREELHQILKSGFKVDHIDSEYGMTELLSQAYAKRDGIFHTPPWMKVIVRQQEDPFSEAVDGQLGGINIIDLANLYSCAFIQTDDLGRKKKDGFEVLGRFDGSEVRGCNLLIS